MGRWNRFLGIFGAVIFSFGILGSWVVGGFQQIEFLLTNPLLMAHLVIGFLCLLTWFFTSGLRNINQTGAIVSGRVARYSYNAVLASVVFVGLLVVVNYFAGEYNKRWDLTEKGVYSLSLQSRRIVENLGKPLKIVALSGIQGVNEEEIKERLGLYKYYSSKVSLEFVDARAKPHLVDKYGFTPGNLIYLEYGEGDKKGVSRINDVTEQAITNALLKLQRGEAKKIYVVEGHGEPAREGDKPDGVSKLMAALSDEHLTVEPILLSLKPSIPDDAAAVVLISPKKSLTDAEKTVLTKYADAGGRLLLLGDPRTTADIKDLAQHFGIKVGDDVVIDRIETPFSAPTLGAEPIVRTYATHGITKDLGAAQPTLFNIASSVTPAEKGSAEVTYTELLKTSKTSWAETDLASLFDAAEPSATQGETDIPGPVSIAVAYEKKLKSEESKKSDSETPNENKPADFQKSARVVVFGDSDWLLNVNINLSYNRDLILNAVNWLAGEEGGVSIRPATMRESVAPIPKQSFYVLLATSFVVPEVLLLMGLIIWWRRKNVFA